MSERLSAGTGGSELTEPTQQQYQWPTSSESYEFMGKIGQGAFASVWRASTKIKRNAVAVDVGEETSKNSEGGEEVTTKEEEEEDCAIKVLNLDHVDSNLAEIRLEVQAMRLSSHPNILTCLTAFVHATDLWLITKLMRKGSSLHCLQGARRKLLQQKQDGQEIIPPVNSRRKMEDHIMYILRETLLGLQYIHDNGQIHRDVKAGNILLNSNGEVRIADFGVSGWLVNAGTQQEKAKTFVGTPCWMAPEVMEQIYGYDYKADIWSLGITALELAKGYAPYAKYPPMKVLILTIQEDPPSLETYEEDDFDELNDLAVGDGEEYSKSFRSFVDGCLQKDPSKRPKSSELLQSKVFFDSMQDESDRIARRQSLVNEVCNLVDDVGSSTLNNNNNDNNINASGQQPNAATSLLPGNSPVSIFISSSSNEENRPAGTTWVFADGSQVLASSTTSNATVDDVMEELDQFGQQTGGENYKKELEAAEAAAKAKKAAAAAAAKEEEEAAAKEKEEATTAAAAASSSSSKVPTAGTAEKRDDISAFMDEFELNTQGENFEHPAKKDNV